MGRDGGRNAREIITNADQSGDGFGKEAHLDVVDNKNDHPGASWEGDLREVEKRAEVEDRKDVTTPVADAWQPHRHAWNPGQRWDAGYFSNAWGEYGVPRGTQSERDVVHSAGLFILGGSTVARRGARR